MNAKPRLLIVGRTRYRLPLDDSVERKFAALGALLEVRVVGSAGDAKSQTDATFRLLSRRRPAILDGALFYATLPRVVAAELQSFRPDAVLAQSVYEATAVHVAKRLSRSRVPVVVDVHGDWGTATRLYGSRLRGVLSPVTAIVSRGALHRADAVRTISGFTTALVRGQGVEPASVFPAYVDLRTFVTDRPHPLPAQPRALFVGVLERYKNVDGLAIAWHHVASRVPGARLTIVGSGRERRVVEELVQGSGGSVEWFERLPQTEIANALDASTCLVLPSRSEGLPRIVIEAFCRARAVVGARAGGIPDIVRDGVNGLLVEADDPDALGEALARVLGDGRLAERLGAGAYAGAASWLQTPDEYAQRIHELVTRVIAA